MKFEDYINQLEPVYLKSLIKTLNSVVKDYLVISTAKKTHEQLKAEVMQKWSGKLKAGELVSASVNKVIVPYSKLSEGLMETINKQSDKNMAKAEKQKVKDEKKKQKDEESDIIKEAMKTLRRVNKKTKA
jgi:hypothetical protein